MLSGIDSSIKIDKTGYVSSSIKKDGFKYLLSFVKKHNISVMERKWYELSNDRRENIYWTEKEIDILKKNYKNSTKEEICKLIPRHTHNGIQGKASKIGCLKYNIKRK